MKKIIWMALVAMGAVAAQAERIVDLSGDFQTCTDKKGIQYIPLKKPAPVTGAMSQFYENDFSAAFYTNGTPVAAGGTYTGKDIYGAIFQKAISGTAAPGALGPTRMEKVDCLTLNASVTNTAGAAINYNFDFMYVFKKADFINGLNTGSIGFDNNSAFKFKASAWRADIREARAVVLNGSTWYISLDRSLDASQQGEDIIISANASNCLWVKFDPLTDIDYDNINFDVPAWPGSTFKDIQAVGIYVHMVKKSATTANSGISSIQIDAVKIFVPVIVGMAEPSEDWHLRS